jgi:hypothetical protein
MNLPKLNIDKGAGSYYLDHLIEEEKRVKGRKGNLMQLRRSKRQRSRRLNT